MTIDLVEESTPKGTKNEPVWKLKRIFARTVGVIPLAIKPPNQRHGQLRKAQKQPVRERAFTRSFLQYHPLVLPNGSGSFLGK